MGGSFKDRRARVGAERHAREAAAAADQAEREAMAQAEADKLRREAEAAAARARALLPELEEAVALLRSLDQRDPARDAGVERPKQLPADKLVHGVTHSCPAGSIVRLYRIRFLSGRTLVAWQVYAKGCKVVIPATGGTSLKRITVQDMELDAAIEEGVLHWFTSDGGSRPTSYSHQAAMVDVLAALLDVLADYLSER